MERQFLSPEQELPSSFAFVFIGTLGGKIKARTRAGGENGRTIGRLVDRSVGRSVDRLAGLFYLQVALGANPPPRARV